MNLGFNDAWIEEGRWTDNTIYDLMHVSAHLIRIPYVWNITNPFPVIDNAQARGIGTLLCPYSFTNEVHRDNGASYLSHVKDLATRYPRSPIECLNEPNYITYGDYTPDEYSDLFRRFRATVKRVNNQRVLMSGSLMQPCGKDPSAWLKAVTAHVGGDYIVSAHVYIAACLNLLSRPEIAAQNILDKTREACPNHDIWVTEFGHSSASGKTWYSDEAEQARIVQAFWTELETQGIKRAYHHRLYDGPLEQYSGSFHSGWGMKRPDGKWKPVVDSVA